MPGQRLSTSIKPKKSRFDFVRNIIAELRKVAWPTRQETIRLSLMVIGVCIVVGIFLGAIDFGFAELISKVFLGG
jgi:preprotein translocase subunit SecE